jgi:hypothetical protein
MLTGNRQRARRTCAHVQDSESICHAGVSSFDASAAASANSSMELAPAPVRDVPATQGGADRGVQHVAQHGGEQLLDDAGTMRGLPRVLP